MFAYISGSAWFASNFLAVYGMIIEKTSEIVAYKSAF